MPQISVVVPVYDVEPYLDACLGSLAAQTARDFEAILVDDGSRDRSAAIAARFADADPRFRVFRQPNGGLGRARNLGADLASGEYLAFLDSDDLLVPDAYERLLVSLCRTGSDFATGNVLRLSAAGCTQAPFLASAFSRSRERTHVRRSEPLLTDRTACNKLWRRSFWDAHALRFPEGRLHEDIPVVVPAHFLARTVDVLAEPVYRYRVRQGSITQRRHTLRALSDRLAAVGDVMAFLEAHESRRQRRRYERSVLAHDLRYHLDVLGAADEEYRALFMERAGAFVASAGRRALAGLPAFDRVRYELVRRGRLDELLALMAEGRSAAEPRRRVLRYHATYPAARSAGVPGGAFRLGRRDQDLALTAALDAVRVDDGRVRLAGRAHIGALGAEWPNSQRLELALVRAGGNRALRMRLDRHRLPTTATRRRDLAPELRWAGFEASLSAATAHTADGGGTWELFAFARAGGVRRRRAVFELTDPALAQTVDLACDDALLTQFAVTPGGRARLVVHASWVRVEQHRRMGNALLELTGSARLEGAADLVFTRDDEPIQFPLVLAGGRFHVQVPLAFLGGPVDAAWAMSVSSGAALSLDDRLSGATWRSDGADLSLRRAADGTGRLDRIAVPSRAPYRLPTSPR